jgi:hypothetical protein
MDKQAQFVHPTMAAPAPGFTGRVMARIEQHERVQARRRSILGAAVLLAAASVPFLALGYLLVSLGSQLLADPGVILGGILVFAPVLEIVSSVLQALAVSATTLARVGSVQMFLFAVAVCSLTFLWAAIVHGSFQWSPRTLFVGGSR